MRRFLLAFAIVVIAAVVFEPLIHTHPLSQNSANPCAVCVNSVAPVTTMATVAISPLLVVGTVALVVAPAIVRGAQSPRDSRAPPAA